MKLRPAGSGPIRRARSLHRQVHSMKTNVLKIRSCVLSLFLIGIPACAAPAAPAGPLVPNGGFEYGIMDWTLFVPEESQGANCRFDVTTTSPHSGVDCLRLQSDDFGRFCVGSASFPVQPGEHYSVSVWIRADTAAQVRPDAPGFVVRLSLRQGGADAPGGHLFVAPGDKVSRETPPTSSTPLPTTWTQIKAVVEIPPGVDAIIPALFSWWTKGTINVDDFTIEKVDASTPVTPVWQKTAATSSAPSANTPIDTASVPTDAELLAALDLNAPGMEKVKAAAQPAANGQIAWNEVQSAYLDYRRNASTARWRVMPDDKPPSPRAKDDQPGDAVLAHHIRNGYHFQPSEGDMGKDFNWTYNPVERSNPAYTDEWTYCAISRTEFWEALAAAYWQTGDEKYATGWVDQLTDFAAKNPLQYTAVPGTPSLWRSLDSAIRISNSWPDAYYHFLKSPSLTPQANWLYLKLNFEHAQLFLHVLQDQNRTGNWVATECAGLFTIGTLFPEFRDASSWRQQSVDRLSLELNRMVPPDGFEAELTPTYHFVSLDGFRKPVELAKLNNLTLPDNFTTKILAMYRAAVLVMDQAGNDVPTNDSSPVSAALKAGAGLKLADDPLLEWAASHGQKGQAPPDSTALPYAGFYAMRGGWKRDDVFLFFRGGPTGIVHQHEDMLEVVLRAWNQTLLPDPGTYTYDQSDWRRYTIGTASHNTIIVDGKWQHRGANKPPVTQPTGDPWVTTPLFDYVAATYDGGYQQSVYRARPFDPEMWKGKPDKSVSHTRRVIFLRPYYALVLDTLDGTGTHTFDAHFHLDSPAARIDPATHAAFSQNTDGAQLALYPLETDNLAVDIVQGQKQPLLGWMPGEHRAIPTIRFRKQQAAPAIFATFLYPYRNDAPAFSATPLPIQGDGLWARSLKTSQENTELILAKNGAPAPIAFTSSLLGNLTAEATGLIIRQPSDSSAIFAGGIDLSSFKDAHVELTLAKPASLVFSHQKDGLLCFNPTDADVVVSLKSPFTRDVTLPPQQWISVTEKGATPATPPALFHPLEPSSATASYTDYLKSFPGTSVAATNDPIRVKGEAMTVPDKASLLPKVGADGKVLARWEESGTVATAQVNVPESGWYRLKVRYCSGEEPVRTLLVNGKTPFTEAEGFALASTIGAPPSDGWSNISDDWSEVALGAAQVSSGWKIYLTKGPCELGLRNDGGGLNLDWIELSPATTPSSG